MAAELGSSSVDEEASSPPLEADTESEMQPGVLALLLQSGEFVPEPLGGVWREAGVVAGLDSADEMGFER